MVLAFALTCYDIQYTEIPGTDNTYPSPYNGQTVTVTGIVTNNTYGTTSTNPTSTKFYISDSYGGPWSGIYVYKSETGVQVGDLVTVTGVVTEYFGMTEIGGTTVTVTINSSGNQLPPLSLIPTNALSNPANPIAAEPYESCFCKVQNVIATTTPNAYQEFYVADGSGAGQIDDGCYLYGHTWSDINIWYQWEEIRGIVDYSSNLFGLNPRNDADMVVQGAGVTQTVNLSSGWNLSSLNVTPSNNNITTLCSGISTVLIQIKGTEGIYIPNNPFNTLNQFIDGKAYSIKVSQNAAWQVSGTAIPVSTAISCQEGWNLIGYVPQASQVVSTAMQSVSTWLLQLKGSDGVYIPNNPFNTLTTMYPGKGYWLKLIGAHNLNYPASKNQDSLIESDQTNVDSSLLVKTLPTSEVVLVKVQNAQPGDYLTAWVGDELRGKSTLINVNGIIGALIQVFTEYPGEIISFKVCSQDNSGFIGYSPFLASEPEATIGDYNSNIYFELTQQLTENQDVTIPPTSLKVCPNPFSNKQMITFDKNLSGNDKVSIFDIKGRLVTVLRPEASGKNSNSLEWNGKDSNNNILPNGVYLIKYNNDKTNIITKTMIMR